VDVFDVVTGDVIGSVARQYDTVLAAAVDPYRELIAAGGSNRKVRVYDLLTDGVAHTVEGHNDWVTAAAFSPDATLLATADRAGAIRVVEALTGRPVHEITSDGGAVHELAFRPDSNVLASAADDGAISLWNMDDGARIKRVAAHSGAALSVDFAADGRFCSGGADGHVKLFDASGGGITAGGGFEPMGDWVYQVRFAAGGAQILAGAWNGKVQLYNAADGAVLWTFDTSPKPSQQVATARPQTNSPH